MSADLAAFYAARLDEMERIALAAGEDDEARQWEGVNNYGSRGVADGHGNHVVCDEGAPSAGQAIHIALHDPEGVLADVEADRRLLGEYEVAEGNRGGGEWTDSSAGHADGLEAGLLLAVKIRAMRFGGHLEYKAEWAP